jgi:hypothetical protein
MSETKEALVSMKNFLKKILFLFLSLYGLWKLLIGFKHTRLAADLSEFPPVQTKRLS